MMKKTYLEDLSEEDRKFSQNALSLLEGKTIVAFSYDSQTQICYIALDDGTQFFIDNIKDKYDLSIT